MSDSFTKSKLLCFISKLLGFILCFTVSTYVIVFIAASDVRKQHKELMEHLTEQTNVVQCVSCQVEEK